MLLQLATRLTGQRSDAEDVVQDVFIGLPEALRRYEERGAFAAWLRRLTARHALMRQRQAQNRHEVPHGVESGALRAPETAPGGDGEFIERALLSLSDGLRQVFVLRVVEGYSHGEIAELLGISAGASEVRLSRAVKALRGLLEAMR